MLSDFALLWAAIVFIILLQLYQAGSKKKWIAVDTQENMNRKDPLRHGKNRETDQSRSE